MNSEKNTFDTVECMNCSIKELLSQNNFLHNYFTKYEVQQMFVLFIQKTNNNDYKVCV